MKNKIVIIPCGFKKAITLSRAKNLYVGPYFKMNLRWARSITNDEDIFILSALYGLLKLDDKIKPYNLKMGMIGSITIEKVNEQAIRLDIKNKKTIGSGGKNYIQVMEKIFTDISFPFKGLSLGYAMQRMKREILNVSNKL